MKATSFKFSQCVALIATLLCGATAAFATTSAPSAPSSSSPAEAMAITRMLNNIFFPFDHAFPTPVATSPAQLNTLMGANTLSSQMTRTEISTQLHALPNTIARAYNSILGTSLYSTPIDANSLQNKIAELTAGRPSYDTLYLPPNSTCTTTELCAHRASEPEMQRNAKAFNFDSFFSPTNNDASDYQNSAQTYITYALQTYQPNLNFQNSSTGSASDSKSFFQALNDQLQNDPKNANSYLVNNVLKNPQFQQYWANLRSLQAKQSAIISNLNFLAAERAPQPGLGAAYGLKDSNGNLIRDASAMQIEQDMVNKTVYNPDWYKEMKTAPLATLQRQQLLLTSMLVRLQYHNQMINERNLATQLILANQMLQQSRVQLQQEEMQLKAALFPDHSDVAAMASE